MALDDGAYVYANGGVEMRIVAIQNLANRGAKVSVLSRLNYSTFHQEQPRDPYRPNLEKLPLSLYDVVFHLCTRLGRLHLWAANQKAVSGALLWIVRLEHSSFERQAEVLN